MVKIRKGGEGKGGVGKREKRGNGLLGQEPRAGSQSPDWLRQPGDSFTASCSISSQYLVRETFCHLSALYKFPSHFLCYSGKGDIEPH